MSIALQHDIGKYLRTEAVLTSSAAVFTASDGAAEQVGRIIDRLALGRAYLSLKVAVGYQALTQSSLGVITTVRVLHATSTAAGDFAAFGSTGVTRTSATTTTATSTAHAGSHEFDFDLRTARRFLQVNTWVRMGASSSGSLGWGALGVFGGADELPPVAPVDRATTS